MNYLYLHGFASSPQSTKARLFAVRFAELGLTLHVPDLAPDGFKNLTNSGQLKVIAASAGDRPATLIGSSMGGYLAALYAARHASVEKLVLLAPAFGFAQRWPDLLGAEAMEDWRRTRIRTVYHYGDRRDRELSYALVEDAFQYEDFPDFAQPSLILHGRRDAVVPASLSGQFAANHPSTRLTLLNSGHELTDVLDRVWDASASFLGLHRNRMC